MMGSKRLGAVESEIGALRQAIDRQDALIGEIEAARAADLARMEALQARLDDICAMLDTSDAQLSARLADMAAKAEEQAGRLAESVAAEQSQRAALEQTLAKLDKRLDAQADEARVTATALLQRMGKTPDQAIAR